MVEVIITQSAQQDLVDIEEYISEQSLTHAQSLVERLINRIKILQTFPLSGSQMPEYDNPNRRQLVEGKYRILYRIESNELIYILRFLHGSRQVES